MFGNECRNEQHVDRQARRAGHERRDENGGEAVALVLDGARGHDGRNGAGIGGEQRDEGLAVEADGAHDAISNERGAGEVTGVFKDSDEQEEQQDLRQEDEHGRDALPCAIEQRAIAASLRAAAVATGDPIFARMSPKPSLIGCPMEKTTSNTPMTTTRKSSGPQMRWSRTLSSLRLFSADSGAL